MPVRPVLALLGACALPVLLAACAGRPGAPSVRAVPTVESIPIVDGQPNRFEMIRDGERMTADDFDAWMQARGIRIAGGKAADDEMTPAASPAKAKAGASGRDGAVRR